MRDEGVVAHKSIFYYPDGSLRSDNLSYSCLISDFFRRSEIDGTAETGFRSLRPFGNKLYSVIYPGWYARLLSKYEEGAVAIQPGDFRPNSEAEENLSSLCVAVRFHRKPSDLQIREFALMAQNWWTDVGSIGVFGEGGIASFSRDIYTHRNFIGIKLDLSDSGQETLNAFALAILDWGMRERGLIDVIDLAASPDDRVFDNLGKNI